jgi:uncharacterized GH25 family protein
MRVETYVTKGAPSDGALRASGKGLELEPVTHPNEIYVDQGFSFVLLVDGKPVGDVGVTVFRGGNAYEDRKIFAEARTGKEGRIDLSFDKPGVYLLKASYPPRRAPSERPPAQAFSYTLTFEVHP